jgi:hypothetical protein
MTAFEYRVVPVPLAHEAQDPKLEEAVETAINQTAQDGWEFLRIDTITHGDPQRIWAERKSVMIFRREITEKKAEPAPLVLTKPILHDQVTGAQKDAPDERPKPTIERAIIGARGGFSPVDDTPDPGYHITRSRNERPRYRST